MSQKHTETRPCEADQVLWRDTRRVEMTKYQGDGHWDRWPLSSSTCSLLLARPLGCSVPYNVVEQSKIFWWYIWFVNFIQHFVRSRVFFQFLVPLSPFLSYWPRTHQSAPAWYRASVRAGAFRNLPPIFFSASMSLLFFVDFAALMCFDTRYFYVPLYGHSHTITLPPWLCSANSRVKMIFTLVGMSVLIMQKKNTSNKTIWRSWFFHPKSELCLFSK